MSRKTLEFNFTNLVFVYGSLKRGEWNNSLLESSDFICEHTTQEVFCLVDCGFPYAVPKYSVFYEEDYEFHPVRGEVWQIDSVDTFYRLDVLEGHPNHYHRVPIWVDQKPCWIYTQPDNRALTLPTCPIVDGAYEWQNV